MILRLTTAHEMACVEVAPESWKGGAEAPPFCHHFHDRFEFPHTVVGPPLVAALSQIKGLAVQHRNANIVLPRRGCGYWSKLPKNTTEFCICLCSVLVDSLGP